MPNFPGQVVKRGRGNFFPDGPTADNGFIGLNENGFIQLFDSIGENPCCCGCPNTYINPYLDQFYDETAAARFYELPYRTHPPFAGPNIMLVPVELGKLNMGCNYGEGVHSRQSNFGAFDRKAELEVDVLWATTVPNETTLIQTPMFEFQPAAFQKYRRPYFLTCGMLAPRPLAGLPAPKPGVQWTLSEFDEIWPAPPSPGLLFNEVNPKRVTLRTSPNPNQGIRDWQDVHRYWTVNNGSTILLIVTVADRAIKNYPSRGAGIEWHFVCSLFVDGYQLIVADHYHYEPLYGNFCDHRVYCSGSGSSGVFGSFAFDNLTYRIT